MKNTSYIVKHDDKIIADASTFDQAWRVIHNASHGASVEWQMKYEGWQIIRRDIDGSETPLNVNGGALHPSRLT